MLNYGTPSARSRVTAFLPQHVTKSCPVCNASKGARCRKATGESILSIHADRAKAVADAQKEYVKHGTNHKR